MELFGLPADRVRTIYLGVDPHVFRPAAPDENFAARTRLGWASGKLTAVFAGASWIRPEQGFDLLFAAWRHLCSDPAWDVDLVAAGSGAELPYWPSAIGKGGTGQPHTHDGLRPRCSGPSPRSRCHGAALVL